MINVFRLCVEYNSRRLIERKKLIFNISKNGNKFDLKIFVNKINQLNQSRILKLTENLFEKLEYFDKFFCMVDADLESIDINLSGTIKNKETKKLYKFLKRNQLIFRKYNSKRNLLYDISIGIIIGLFTVIIAFFLGI